MQSRSGLARQRSGDPSGIVPAPLIRPSRALPGRHGPIVESTLMLQRMAGNASVTRLVEQCFAPTASVPPPPVQRSAVCDVPGARSRLLVDTVRQGLQPRSGTNFPDFNIATCEPFVQRRINYARA